MIGKCLCERVRFQITGSVPNLYQCHCSLCRKQSGTASNAATFIHESNFSWLEGESQIAHYKKATGFTSDFCATCGCPVPNRLRDTDKYWVPAGLLEGAEKLRKVADICTASSIAWEPEFKAENQFADMPAFETLNKILCAK
jgi:hypothetical protein